MGVVQASALEGVVQRNVTANRRRMLVSGPMLIDGSG
jgi:hypothetical protein